MNGSEIGAGGRDCENIQHEKKSGKTMLNACTKS